jgi:hypothetical protein
VAIPERAQGRRGSVKLANAIEHLFVPIARALVRSGATAAEAIESIKRSYVVATAEYFHERGWPVTTARLQVFTGMTHSEVSRIQQDLASAKDVEPSKFNQIIRLLTTWHLDARYAMPIVGDPRDLLIVGGSRNDPSFEMLARECAPFLNSNELLSELERVGAVRINPDTNRVHVLSRTFVPEPYDEASIERFGRVVRALAETLDRNFRKSGPGKGRFERNVSADFAISAEDEAEFDALLRTSAQKFLEDLDAWLSKRKRVPEHGRRVGVEVFHFIETGVMDDSKLVDGGESSGADSEPEEIDTLTFQLKS